MNAQLTADSSAREFAERLDLNAVDLRENLVLTDYQQHLIDASDSASRRIPPLWPLSSSVAVNPFLGQTQSTLSDTAALLGQLTGTPVTMPLDWYHLRIENDTITDDDLAAALANAPEGSALSVDALKSIAAGQDGSLKALPTIADLAQEVSGIDWPSLIADRIGAWAAGYFDAGQSLWQPASERGAYESWHRFASRDLTPEISGLSGFTHLVSNAPLHASSTLLKVSDAIELTPDATASYFHQLLLALGGWSQLARHQLWQAELNGCVDATNEKITTDMLTIRLLWEYAIWMKYQSQIATRWTATLELHAAPATPSRTQLAAAVLQEAAERASQRKLALTLSGSSDQENTDGRPSLQAAFCIDVRSEVFRRALESLSPDIQTLGFAGFFGLTVSHNDFASDVSEARLPVLLAPSLQTSSTDAGNAESDLSARLTARAARAWGRFKLAAVSSFAFVEATGPWYAAKLLRDAFGLFRPANATATPHFSAEFAINDRIAAAGKILRAMSLQDNFAPLVLLVGHGANVTNNPHASTLHCGACGGYAGDVNARLLAELLNDSDVRDGLANEGIDIPTDTIFLGALHDTTTDAVTVFDSDSTQRVPVASLSRIKEMLLSAGSIARTERAVRLPRAEKESDLVFRSTDWAETRPEWALAGCNAFIAAPRKRTRGKSLGGRVFLHEYEWAQDKGFDVLELILTAPVVVASWISLQYYGSVVAPDVFGAGNKLLHNVTGGVGVVEGNGGTLRSGLPWQSVHDGNDFAHDPLRLTVCIEAPLDAVNDILDRHPDVRALFDNRWMHLFLLDSEGQMSQRYAGNLVWETAAQHQVSNTCPA